MYGQRQGLRKRARPSQLGARPPPGRRRRGRGTGTRPPRLFRGLPQLTRPHQDEMPDLLLALAAQGAGWYAQAARVRHRPAVSKPMLRPRLAALRMLQAAGPRVELFKMT